MKKSKPKLRKQKNPHNKNSIFSPENQERKIVNRLSLLLNEEVMLKIWINLYEPIREFYGILKKSINSIESYATQIVYHNYLFQFNPLTQPLSEKNRKTLLKERIGDLHPEDHMIMEQELEFMYDNPSYEIEFNIFDIMTIKDNVLLIKLFKFLPKEIK